MQTYPVLLSVTPAVRYERIQLLLRLVIGIALGWIGIDGGWLSFGLYLFLPVIAAIAISTRGSNEYLTEVGPRLWRALKWVFAFFAYMLLLTDRFPTSIDEEVTCELQPGGTPTAGSALLRLIMSIPIAIAIVLLSIVSCVLFLVGAVTILVEEKVPHGIQTFQLGFLRVYARLFAYHASLVDVYPTLTFEEPALLGHDQRGLGHEAR